MEDKDAHCDVCGKETKHMDMGADLPRGVRFKCKQCGAYHAGMGGE